MAIPFKVIANTASGASSSLSRVSNQGFSIPRGIVNNSSGGFGAVRNLGHSLLTQTQNLGNYFQQPGQSTKVGDNSGEDHRIKIIPFDSTAEQEFFGQGGPMNVLNSASGTGGIIFPYTPQITMSHDVTWGNFDLVHVNQDQKYFTKANTVTVNILGGFTAQNEHEARYCLAVIHWIRSCTKMRFGRQGDTSNTENGPTPGLPPRAWKLKGYGNYIFNEVPILIESASFDLTETVDYVRVVTDDQGEAWVPSSFSVSISAIVQQTPQKWRDEFNLDDFISGKLFKKAGSGGGWL